MADKRSASRFFWLVGAAAAWMFGYVMVHEWLTSRYVAEWRPDPSKLRLSREDAARLSAPGQLEALAEVYDRGARVFGKCVICHALREGASTRRFGPTLDGILNAQVAGKDAGGNRFRYSRVLRTMGEQDLDWTLPLLWAFVQDPATLAPETRMPFPGLKSEQDTHALLHYLAWAQAGQGIAPVPVRLDLDALEGRAWREIEGGICVERPVTGGVSVLGDDPALFLLPRQVLPDDVPDCRD